MTTSLNGAYAVGPGASVTDAQGNVYTIDDAGQIVINGVVDPTTAGVDGLGFKNGMVWQKNVDNLWYSKTSADATWVDLPPSSGVPITSQYVSPNNTSSSYSISDANLNTWTINTAGQIVTDRIVDLTTSGVIKLEYVNGRIWQENADGNFYSKLTPSDTWTSATAVDPLNVTAQLWRGGQSNNDPTQGGNWSQGHLPTANQTLTMINGTMNLGGGNLAGDTLTIANQSPATVTPVINMTAGGNLKLTIQQQTTESVRVNVTGGQATLDVIDPYPSTMLLTVTADKLSSILLSSRMTFGKLTETGGTVLLNGTNQFNGTNVVLNSNIGGTGTINLATAQSLSSHLEVGGAIGAGVTIVTRGDPFRNAYSSVVLDNAAADKGTITLRDAFLEIKAAGVDSVSYTNSMLSLYHGNTVVSAVKVVGIAETGSGAQNNGLLSFGRDTAGNIYAETGVRSLPITPLPLHG